MLLTDAIIISGSWFRMVGWLRHEGRGYVVAKLSNIMVLFVASGDSFSSDGSKAKCIARTGHDGVRSSPSQTIRSSSHSRNYDHRARRNGDRIPRPSKVR